MQNRTLPHNHKAHLSQGEFIQLCGMNFQEKKRILPALKKKTCCLKYAKLNTAQHTPLK